MSFSMWLASWHASIRVAWAAGKLSSCLAVWLYCCLTQPDWLQAGRLWLQSRFSLPKQRLPAAPSSFVSIQNTKFPIPIPFCFHYQPRWTAFPTRLIFRSLVTCWPRPSLAQWPRSAWGCPTWRPTAAFGSTQTFASNRCVTHLIIRFHKNINLTSNIW